MTRVLLRGRESLGRRLLADALVGDPRFVLDEFQPCYRRLTPAALAAKGDAARRELAECRACPRDCGVNRLADETGTCNTGRLAVVASAFHHFGEEDCLRGWNGSGRSSFRCAICGACSARTGTSPNGVTAWR